MELFLTIEIQAGAEKMSDILDEVTKKLSFVTDKDAGLEDIDNYGTEFRSIAIIPSCMDDDFWDALGWKERKQIWRKKREADIRLRVDYGRFVNESYENQRLMFIAAIIQSISVVLERSKGNFQGEKLILDILQALEVTQLQLEEFIQC